ncbi:ribonuclease P [archaeon CG_4_8_14_3_um_filter_38_5]|nr:MAG: ribonuclease P [archaeon CG07_land_8_20_14_0_80_38_8]PIU88962.1 MAG: ribonuclease P [archaeon CG06_land_8_20_14_3_00_37_11]PIX43507.1 MAG: ribonuclease P [archaeon CG_4_8_14_3_um_filter_38_5]
MINKKNVMNHEFIGLKTEVKNSGMKGIIVDETKNTFIIRSNTKDKIIPKKGNEFKLNLAEGDYTIKGDAVMQRPYERLRKKYKVKNKWGEI